MPNAITTHPDAERLAAACVLSTVGGFLDIYTYLFRGHVFANAVTGNMVLFGFTLAERNWEGSSRYLLAILFYALGVFTAEMVHNRLPASRRISWNQTVILLEIACLLPVFFIPCGEFDFIVNSLISFVCALQAQTFRRVHGLPFASTMCTGNLRSGTEAFFHFWLARDSRELRKSLHYYGVIICFVAGALFGTLLLREFGLCLFFLAPAGLFAAFLLITPKRRLALWRRTVKRLYRRSKREQPDAPSR